jgi:hypothetical protein
VGSRSDHWQLEYSRIVSKIVEDIGEELWEIAEGLSNKFREIREGVSDRRHVVLAEPRRISRTLEDGEERGRIFPGDRKAERPKSLQN